MALTQQEKQQIFTDYGTHEGDTGSAQVQIAMLTKRINQLIDHHKTHKHDEHSRRGLLKLVGQRRRHLRYLTRQKAGRYQDIISRLGLRK